MREGGRDRWRGRGRESVVSQLVSELSEGKRKGWMVGQMEGGREIVGCQ